MNKIRLKNHFSKKEKRKKKEEIVSIIEKWTNIYIVKFKSITHPPYNPLQSFPK